MKPKDKIDAIIRFMQEHSESTASRAIKRRYFPHTDFESSQELSFSLEDVLNNYKNDENRDEIDFCYYLIK